MKKNVIAALTVILILIAGTVIYTNMKASANLSEDAIGDMLEERYDGEVKEIRSGNEQGEDIYQVELAAREGTYYIVVLAETGEILEMELLEHNEDGEGKDRQTLTVEEISERVLDSVDGDATILEVEQREEEGRAIYHVTVDQEGGTGTFELDAVSGEVLLYTQEEDEPEQQEPISEDEAIEIALREFQGEVDDVDLEQKDGRLVYDIEIENDDTDVEADIIIDAYTGEVISVTFDD
ncbi:PepSY domain-containing protein [Bacillus sp. H-16]|uniref:PepSY domain-containing protein n=1 Tax=Alteribacter salitolerans TaxID=2912333 RepID=UPI00196444E0|nr:PepSY domain-containing protein [Alteribacter salitolerans]MBM7094285.1 PepSY domain-containing protein [Alteribacter salitolerans]